MEEAVLSALCVAGMIYLVAAAVGVSRGRESVVDLRKGPQGALPWEAGEERGEASALRGARFLFSRSHSSSLLAPDDGRRRLKAPRPAGSWFWFHFAAQLWCWDLFLQPPGPRIYCYGRENLAVIHCSCNFPAPSV